MSKMSTERMRSYIRNRRHDNRSAAVCELGGCCCKCYMPDEGYHQFDHIDPSTKEFDISDMLHLPWSKILVELAKCQLLCEDCHKKKTSKWLRENTQSAVHGTLSCYRHCKCVLCVEANREYHRNYMRERRKRS
jgi:5-methylcytosine-specific restriction endonuclease McrA